MQPTVFALRWVLSEGLFLNVTSGFSPVILIIINDLKLFLLYLKVRIVAIIETLFQCFWNFIWEIYYKQYNKLQVKNRVFFFMLMGPRDSDGVTSDTQNK